MRRVYDDFYYNKVSKEIYKALRSISRDDVSEYEWGMKRSQRSLIMRKILFQVPDIKWGKSCNTTGIGNNGCYEVIYTGNDKEEQIIGLIHLTDNMFGTTICWVSDIDNDRKTLSVHI